MNKKIYKGSIYFCDKSKKKTPMVNFDLTPKHDFNVCDTLMGEFKDLKLTQDEKQLLTQEFRKNILCYKTLTMETINPYIEKLVKKVSRLNKNLVKIKASEMGTFICLAAICSGKLPEDKQIIFELDIIPFKYFPKILRRSLKKFVPENISVNFYFEKDNWIKPFKSLYEGHEFHELDQQNQTQAA